MWTGIGPRICRDVGSVPREQRLAMSAGRIPANRLPFPAEEGSATPTPALHDLRVRPVLLAVAKAIVVRNHYLHSLPGGTKLSFGIFLGSRLLGAVTLGVGPFNVPSLVEGATADDCLTLTRLWLSDELPKNSESRVLGVMTRALRKGTSVRFLVAYSDPAMGHVGTIYQATGWVYTGLSEAMPLYDVGDGVARHSRSLSHAFGTHSVNHFRNHGVAIKVIPQQRKHRYVRFLDPSWRSRLRVTVLPYPKREVADEGH